ncbi:MAG: DUF4249 domain-containing protein [Bacteroidales bacterium]|nr:DUF4249 domain-containing protein [Bacteroidales bacterium]
MNKIYTLLLLFVLIISSCTEEIQLDLGTIPPQLVVDGAITNEAKVHTIYLRKTGDYFYNQPVVMVSGAAVSISDGTTNVLLAEDPNSPGAYRTASDFAGVVGHTYTLSISNVDVDGDGVKESYSASCFMPTIAPMDSISVEKRRMFRQDIWEVRMSMQDLPNEKNFYLARIYRNDVCTSDSINEWGITNDDLFDGSYLYNETVMFFRSEKPDEKLVDGDKVGLEMCGITEDYMKFINDVDEEYRGRNPLFGGQPANIRTNVVRTFPSNSISNGVRGYFAAYSVSWGEIIYRVPKAI